LILQRFDDSHIGVVTRCSRRRIENAIQLVRLIGNGCRRCREPLSFKNFPMREPAENTKLLKIAAFAGGDRKVENQPSTDA